MTNRTRTYLTMALMATALFTSCSNGDEDDGSINPSNREKTILGQWVVTRHESDIAYDDNRDGENNTDILTDETEDCAKDDVYNFLDGELKEYNRYDTTDNDGTTCHPEGESYYVFQYHWQLNDDNTQLLLDTEMSGEYDYILEIVSFTQNELEIQDRYETTIDGVVQTVTETLILTRVE